MPKMSQLLLHGPAKIVSRKKLLEIKQKFDPNNVMVFEQGSSIQEMLTSLKSMPLLSEERLVILENPPQDLTLNYQLITINLSLIAWFDHEITKKPILEWFERNGQVMFFPEAKEKSIFPFLDMLAASDNRVYFELEQLKKAGFEMQYFLVMVFYLLRNLAVTPKNAPVFVKQKLQKQRQNFDLVKITRLYREVLEIDFKIKVGLLEINQAEFLLLNKFIDLSSQT